MREFTLGGDGQKEETEVVQEPSFTSLVNGDEFTQMGCILFIDKIVNNGNNFELYAQFDLKPIRRFKCKSDVCMLRSAADGSF